MMFALACRSPVDQERKLVLAEEAIEEGAQG
jgi:hypothetical protein